MKNKPAQSSSEEVVKVLVSIKRADLDEFLAEALPNFGKVSNANAILIRCGKPPVSRGAPVGSRNNPKGRPLKPKQPKS